MVNVLHYHITDLKAISALIYFPVNCYLSPAVTLQTAKVLYDSNPELTKEDITEILFTDLFGSINLFLAELDHGKDDSEIRDEAADLLTDCFEEFDFYGDFE